MLSKKVAELEFELYLMQVEKERLLKRLQADPLRKPMACKDCKHFIPHFGYSDGEYHAVNCGHCTAGKSCKHRNADNKTCEYFEYGVYSRLEKP